jgi:hypothetical protein
LGYKMSKGLIERLLSVEAEEPPSSAARETLSQLADPTLDERVRLYLRAVRGTGDFGNEEYSSARNLILNAMAAEIAEKTGYNLEEQPPVRSDIPSVAIFDAAQTHAYAAQAAFDYFDDELYLKRSELSAHQKIRGSRVSGGRFALKGIEFLGRRSGPPPKFSLWTIGPLSIAIAAAVIVGAGTFAVFRNNDFDSSSLAWLDKLQKQTKQEVAVDFSQKQSKSGSSMPAPQANAPGMQFKKEELAELIKRGGVVGTPPPTTQAGPAAVASRSPIQRLTPAELAELNKRAQELTDSGGNEFVHVSVSNPLGVADLVAPLVRRGRELISAGKIGDARVLLRIAAEANDATAAFVLATTYDPMVLEKFKARDSDPDIKTAQAWYQKASDLGSTEASDWLKAAGSNHDR